MVRHASKGVATRTAFIVSMVALTACGGKTSDAGASSSAGGSTGSRNPSGSAGSPMADGSVTDTPGSTISVGSFEDPAAFTQGGLWMGTGLTGQSELPIEKLAPPRGASQFALHITGTAGASGVDIFFHTAVPMESMARAVQFWARTDSPEGERLDVTVGGPDEAYWKDIAKGDVWPADHLSLNATWQTYRVSFEALGFGPEHLAPHSKPFGAVHFALPPNRDFDLWLDDVTLELRSPQ